MLCGPDTKNEDVRAELQSRCPHVMFFRAGFPCRGKPFAKTVAQDMRTTSSQINKLELLWQQGMPQRPSKYSEVADSSPYRDTGKGGRDG